MSTPPNVSVAFTAEDRGISAAISSLSNQLKQLAVQQKEVAVSATEAAAAEESLSGSMHEAKGAAALLGEEVGVKLNRHLRGVLASSELLGPILAAAFPVAAAIGFAEVIVHATEKLTEWVSETFIFTEAMKEMNKTVAAENVQLEALAKAHAAAAREQELAGKSALDQAALRKKWADEDAVNVKTTLEGEEAKRKSLTETIKVLQARKVEEEAKAEAPTAPEAFAIESPELGEINKQIAEAQKKLTELPTGQLGTARTQAATDAQITAQQKVKEARDAEETAKEKALETFNAKVLAEGVRYLEQEERLTEETKKLATERADWGAKEEQRVTIEKNKQDLLRLAADVKASEAQEKSAEKVAIDAISLQQKQVEARAARGTITGAQELAQLKQLAQQKLDIENEYLDRRITEINARLLTENGEAYAKDKEEWQKLQDEKLAASDRFNSATVAATDAAAKHLSVFQTAQKAIAQDIGTFFTEGITQAHSFGEAFANLARSIIGDLQKMAAEFVLTAIKKKLLGDTGASGEGDTGGGGGIGGFLGGILGALKFASGGPVTGPGGPKSDVIPAMLSSGEFVLNADAVKALGQANLQTLNMATNVPHLAAGGFVGGGGQATASEISMGIGLDEGLILRHLGSKAAGKVILQQLTNNSKGAQRALSRTD